MSDVALALHECDLVIDFCESQIEVEGFNTDDLRYVKKSIKTHVILETNNTILSAGWKRSSS